MQLLTTGLLIIEDRKLLLAFSKNKQCYYLPGGKIDPGETATHALCREIAEELSLDLDEHELVFYTHITAPAFGEENGIIMEQDCFMITKKVRPVAAAEIGALRFFSLDEYLAEEQQAPGAVLILNSLKSKNLID